MYEAKLKFYADAKKTVAVIFNEEQENREKIYFQGYGRYRTITFAEYKDKKNLINNIIDYIIKYYDKEGQNGYSENCIKWIKYTMKKVMLEEIYSTSLVLYDNELFDIGFRQYIEELRKDNKKNENS